MVSGQQLLFKQASAKVRAEGVKPFTKAFGKRMKQILGGKSKSVKKRTTKTKKNKSRKTKNVKSKSNPKKTVVANRKGGTKGMTRLKKFLLGLGVGAGVSTVAGLTRVREVEFLGPIIDAGVGGGVEGQVGVAIPKIIRLIATRAGFNGGFNGGGSANGGEGA